MDNDQVPETFGSCDTAEFALRLAERRTEDTGEELREGEDVALKVVELGDVEEKGVVLVVDVQRGEILFGEGGGRVKGCGIILREIVS